MAERDAVVRAVEALQRSFDAGDRRRLCTLLGVTARRQAGEVAHGRQDACPQDLAEAFGVIDAGGGMRGARGSRVGAVGVEGRVATAAVALGGEGSVGVPLVREGGVWRLGTFFGSLPREAMAEVTSDRTDPFPPSRGGVAVSERGGFPCLPLFGESYPQVGGGCEVNASARRLRVSIATAFGRFMFGECDLIYRVRVDERGRAWTDSVAFNGPDNDNNGCADLRACENTAGEPLPWKGRLSAEADGRFVHRMNVCLDTCIGFYGGQLAVTITVNKQGWRANFADASIGKSGLGLDGPLDLDTGGVELEPAS